MDSAFEAHRNRNAGYYNAGAVCALSVSINPTIVDTHAAVFHYAKNEDGSFTLLEVEQASMVDLERRYAPYLNNMRETHKVHIAKAKTEGYDLGVVWLIFVGSDMTLTRQLSALKKPLVEEGVPPPDGWKDMLMELINQESHS